MEFKVIILSAMFLLANAGTPRANHENTRQSQFIRNLPGSNRAQIRVKNSPEFVINVPETVTTYRPRSAPTQIRTSTPLPAPTENYQSGSHQTLNYQSPENQSPNYQSTNYQAPNYQSTNHQSPNYQSQIYQTENYQPQKYQPMANYESQNYDLSNYYQQQKYQSPNYQPQKYESQNNQPLNYQLSNYQIQNHESQNYQPQVQKSQNSYNLGNSPAKIVYATEPQLFRSEQFSSLRNPESVHSNKPQQSEIVNTGTYTPVFSKSGYATISKTPLNPLNSNLNHYSGSISDSAPFSTKNLSHYNPVTQKPKVKIAYSPASEVSHVSFSSGDGQVHYNW